MKGRLEMGRRLLKLLGSEPGFFNMGVTAAVLLFQMKVRSE